MTAMEFSPQELETLRVALLSAHYAADDEERALHRKLEALPHLSPEWMAAEDGRAKAAMRAFAYHLLAERVMAAQESTPVTGEAGER